MHRGNAQSVNGTRGFSRVAGWRKPIRQPGVRFVKTPAGARISETPQPSDILNEGKSAVDWKKQQKDLRDHHPRHQP
jgi:hypothetical protein